MTQSAAPQAPAKPRKGAGTIVLLVLVTLANSLLLVLSVAAWADEADHGADFDDPVLVAMALSAIFTVVALAGLVGAWLTRKWGPRLYVGVAGTSLVVGLIIAEGQIAPLSLVGVGLAVLLWLIAESSW